MLEVSNLVTGYGKAQALDGVTFDLARGGALALLGRNGAGKSTTLKAMMGLLPVWAGDVRLGGESLNRMKPEQIARLGLGYVPEDRRVFANLTVTENLIAGAKPGPEEQVTWQIGEALALFPEIARRKSSPAGTLSGGERQMLSIARALMGNPSLLLLDEPSEGLAPVVVDRLAQALSELRTSGLTMIVAEQNQRFAAKIADRVVILETGKSRFDGTFDDLADGNGAPARLLGFS